MIWRFVKDATALGLTAEAAPIFDIVLERITVRGSIVGTRKDLAEALAFSG